MHATPIETRFRGYRFRSRLEARWAVFFSALDLRWDYEIEGFDLGEHGRYLPDFRVRYPGRDLDESHYVWFEVKPDLVTVSDDEWRRLCAFNDTTDLIMLDGVPAERMYINAREALYRRNENPDAREGMALWCGKGRLWWDTPETWWKNTDGPPLDLLRRAITAARSARFETWRGA